MRMRVRGPEGTTTITVEDKAQVSELKAQISSATGLGAFDVKYGYPPQPLDLDEFGDELSISDTGLKLNGEQLTVSPKDIGKALNKPLNDPPQVPAPVSQTATSASSSSAPRKTRLGAGATKNAADASSDPPEIAAPALEGTIVLRVMPDDNSCLFRALSYAVLGDFDSMHELRGIVATEIQNNHETYSSAVLEKDPNDYCKWIMRDDSW